MRERRATVRRWVAGAACAGLGAGALPGCYERTIRVEGWNYEEKRVEEPYASDGPVEDLIFGKQKVERKSPDPVKTPKPN